MDEITAKADPERYKILDSGAIYDLEVGRIVGNSGSGKYAITPENAHAMHARARMKGLLSQLRGLAKAEGVELPPDADMEKVIEGAGDALEAITMHFAKTFKESNNLRGMAEGYRQLAAPMIGEAPQPSATYNTAYLIEVPEAVAQAMIQLRQRLHPLGEGTQDEDFRQAIEGTVKD